eukprot:GHRQ01017946.1.p1 GENE.GHRQ01017946.1~~GHRQ01017946.1.p1  ORF type:complete len:223 (+),score=51.67 GHRQ01017946.1:150-818(+)
MPRVIKVAATQLEITRDPDKNLAKAEEIVREAAAAGANVILLQELFENWYFCQEQKGEYFDWAKPLEESKPVQRLSKLAKELGVVLPVSFFERVNNAHFNSLAMIDADGTVLGVYRKSHIPDGPGYQEKFYFSPGDTGFKVWDTKFGRLGAAICWDQWFPEAARSMALMGAEVGSCCHSSMVDLLLRLRRVFWFRAAKARPRSGVTITNALRRPGRSAVEAL